MKGLWIRRVLLVVVLAGAGLAIGCGGGSNPEGTYRNSEPISLRHGEATVELKGGKASFDFVPDCVDCAYSPTHIDGAYSVDGDKLTIRPLEGDTSQTKVFVINKDGSLQAPEGSPFGRLDKMK